MVAKYKARKDELDGESHCTLFVGRLNPETDEKSLLKAFQKYGEIVRTKIIRDIVTGFSKCYGFVEFEKEKSAIRARQDAHEDVVDERVVFVDWEFAKSLPGWVPRRLGGGFGGKKESGQLRFGGRDRPFKKPINLHRKGPYQPRDIRGYTDDDSQNSERYRDRDRRDKDRDRDRERDKDRERDREKDRGRERDRNRDRDRYSERGRDQDRERDKDKERDQERDRGRGRDRDRDSDRRSRLKDRIKIEDEDNRDDSGREKKGRY